MSSSREPASVTIVVCFLAGSELWLPFIHALAQATPIATPAPIIKPSCPGG